MREKLMVENPELMREWDYEKNGAMNPDDFTGGSNKKVWWKCARGHSWQAQINKRFTYGRGCPYCAGQKVWRGFNDLITTHPHIAKEWDDLKNGDLRPEQFSAGGDIKIWWKCGRGHSWQALIYSRKNCGCPVCASNILTVGVNDLLTANPKLAAEWDFTKNNREPDSIAANSNKKSWWLCEKNHSWEAVISSRNSGKGCPYCNRRLVMPGFNDLRTAAPELVTEWDYDKNGDLRPDMVMSNSPQSVWWKCERNHSWKSQITNRRNGCGCPYCAGKLVISGESDLKTLRPELCEEWDCEKNPGISPDQVTLWSQKKTWWRCVDGHSFEATIANRAKGNGCPYCAGKRPVIGKTDFQTIHPELISEWDYEKNAPLCPEDITAVSHKKIWWRCKNGHSWRTQAAHRHKGNNCPYCSGLLAVRGETDLRSVLPELVCEWDFERNEEIILDDIKPYSNKRVWWVCKNGHHWLSTVGARYAGSGCPYCHGKIPMRTRLVK